MKLNVVEILKHLPKTNCRECGEPTCMVFATKLLKREANLEACPPLFTQEHESKLRGMMELMAGAAA